MDESTSNNKTRIEDLTDGELSEHYNLLKKQYDNLLSDFETLKQELHETKRRYETSLEIQSHVRADLEIYKVEEKKQKTELLSRITTLQEEITTLQNERSEKADQNTVTITKLKAENRRLKEEQAVVSRKSPERDTKEVDEIHVQLSSTTFETATAKAALEEARVEIASWRLKFEELVTEIGELREASDIRREELKSVVERESAALAELAETRAMLFQADADNQQPLASKGNSIFAEVEDKRQEIAKNLLQIKQANAKLRQELANKQMEVEGLLHEKQTVWEEQAGATAHYDRELLDGYEDRITQLEALCERHRREICRWFGKPADPTAPGWLPELIQHWKKECEILQSELLSQTPVRVASSALIRELRRKIALQNVNSQKQSPVNEGVDKNEISMYKMPAKIDVKKFDVKKKVSFN